MSLLSRLAVQAARAYGILSARSTNVSADYLVVAGGGGGGGAYYAGGGGGGGYQTSTATLNTGVTYTVTVGAGGNGGANGVNGAQGSNSVLSGTGLTTITSVGGGYGSYSGGIPGGDGGSGGGAGNTGGSGGTATSGQGNNGGSCVGNLAGGGGGGAGAAGTNSSSSVTGANGGNGSASSISGSSVTYAGGGGGGGISGNGGTGGTGGGGNGGNQNTAPTAGTANLGGGGGGCNGNSGSFLTGAAGGSGIVIISYTSATPKFVGGTITTSGGKQIHTFTSSGTLSPITPITAEYLVVAGGGAGGVSYGGGGGAGGYQTSSTTLYSGATYVVTVGAGGAGTATSGVGASGSNSVISGTGLTTITSTGGGGGGGASSNGGNGGSGGGASSNGNPGNGTSGQGNNGGNDNGTGGSGGGGGAGAVGGNAVGTTGGSGGAGSSSSISGSSVTYAGGGAGYGDATPGSGGSGGGGAYGTSGTANTGGGGGAWTGTGNAGSGGSGIVIISYAGSQVFNGGLVTTSGGNTIHTFTSSGALTPLTNNLNNSLRFRSSASAYLNRTPASAGNRRTWTWSAWVKRGTLTTAVSQYLFEGTPGSGKENPIVFGEGGSSDKFSFYGWNGSGFDFNLKTTQVFRDISAWYHLVVAVDTTQATSSNRVKIYVNGNQISAFDASTYPSQNYDMAINNNIAHRIGTGVESSSRYFDGYMADINFIDGQALEPYYFGNNDANGVWKPIQYKGTYGTNGFYLNFADTSALTTSSNAGLGKDTSGNGNYWTTNNISITSGSTYDAMTDVPTNTSATVANYCVLNPIAGQGNGTYSDGNLAYLNGVSATWKSGVASIGASSGKYYFEYTITAVSSSSNFYLGVAGSTYNGFASYLGKTSDSWAFQWNGASSNKINNDVSTTVSTAGSISANDVIQVAIDLGTGSIWWGRNNTWVQGDPTAGTGASYTNLSGTILPAFAVYSNGGDKIAANFGQRPFAYTPPTGYVALNTFNLPTPTILQGNKYMDATLWTGTGTTQVIVNQALFQPDFVWVKGRSGATDHALYDAVRGVQKQLESNTQTAETTESTGLTAFGTNGFTVGALAQMNTSAATYVGWQWQANGAGSSNTSGSITSTVSVSTTAGFSIVTWTGSAGATVGHGLGVEPHFIIVKSRTDGAAPWVVYTKTTGKNVFLELNSTNAQNSSFANYWGTGGVTSSVFGTYGTAGYANNVGNLVAYCWAEIAGYSKFGSYAGNSSTDGPFIYLGFRPKFVIFKDYSNAHSWIMVDSSRNTYNVAGDYLRAESSAVENATYSVANNTAVDFLSNGFKLRNAAVNSGENNGSSNYLYMAWAENPFKNSNAR